MNNKLIKTILSLERKTNTVMYLMISRANFSLLLIKQGMERINDKINILLITMYK